MVRWLHICLLLLVVSSVTAQELPQVHNKVFNFGATAGFSSALPIVNSITINDMKMEDIEVLNKVGYTASVFGRINISNFFIQPSFSWTHSYANIAFSLPQMSEEPSGDISRQEMDIKIKSLEVPVLIGWNVIKEEEYALSITAGPKFKYNYHVSYAPKMSNTTHDFINDSSPYDISIAAGVGVSIWRLFFDFVYEFGLNQVESDFKDKQTHLPLPEANITINKRINVLSFSIGFLF
jgi:hypothetical protein